MGLGNDYSRDRLGSVTGGRLVRTVAVVTWRRKVQRSFRASERGTGLRRVLNGAKAQRPLKSVWHPGARECAGLRTCQLALS